MLTSEWFRLTAVFFLLRWLALATFSGTESNTTDIDEGIEQYRDDARSCLAKRWIVVLGGRTVLFCEDGLF